MKWNIFSIPDMNAPPPAAAHSPATCENGEQAAAAASQGTEIHVPHVRPHAPLRHRPHAPLNSTYWRPWRRRGGGEGSRDAKAVIVGCGNSDASFLIPSSPFVFLLSPPPPPPPPSLCQGALLWSGRWVCDYRLAGSPP